MKITDNQSTSSKSDASSKKAQVISKYNLPENHYLLKAKK